MYGDFTSNVTFYLVIVYKEPVVIEEISQELELLPIVNITNNGHH